MKRLSSESESLSCTLIRSRLMHLHFSPEHNFPIRRDSNELLDFVLRGTMLCTLVALSVIKVRCRVLRQCVYLVAVACAAHETKLWLWLNRFAMLVLGPHPCTQIWVRAMIGLFKINATFDLPIKMKGNSKRSSGYSLSPLWALTRIGTLRSSDATATRTSLKKWICVLSVFIAIIPTHLLCQM